MEKDIKLSVSQDTDDDLGVILLGKATKLTQGIWGMWPEYAGEEARS